MSFRELFLHWTYQAFAPGTLLRNKYNAFKELLRLDDQCLERIADLEEIHYGREQADWARVTWLCEELGTTLRSLIEQLQSMGPTRYMDLLDYFSKINFYVRMAVTVPDAEIVPPFVFPLTDAMQHARQAGGKALHLAQIAHATDLPLPPGMVISASAFHYFIEANELRPLLDERLRQVRLTDPAELAALADEMQLLIHEAEMSDPIANEIEIAALELGSGGKLLAVRSSAVAEDGEASFAGQYTSKLNVSASDIMEAWKEVVASKYTPRAIAYRIMHGLADSETPMGVLIMPMIEPACAGVVYTRAPEMHANLPVPDREHGALAVFAVEGLGEALVDGSTSPHTALLSRRPSHRLIDKPADFPVPTPTLKRLAEHAMQLEDLFGAPQDVEWVMDGRNRLHILQSRAIQADRTAEAMLHHAPPDLPVLISATPAGASAVAAGRTTIIPQCSDIQDMPRGSVLVTRNLGPALSRVIDRVAAVIALKGSRASHFASVAREFGVPVIVDAAGCLESLENGIIVTVDGITGTVHAGRPDFLPEKPPVMHRQLGAMRRLGMAMPRIAKLNLTDPMADNFAPEFCRSMHDLVRFAHERGVEEMFTLVGRSGRGLSGARKLKSDIPISLYLLNLEDGLFHSAAGKPDVTPDDIRSVPMWALWFGLSCNRVQWPTNLKHVDWNELDRVSAGIINPDSPQLASYAVLSHTYLHMMVRFGYHFSVIDTLCGPEARQNYIKFRFKGGGGRPEQRILRLQFIERVLSRFGFFVTTRGDLLDARHPAEEDSEIQKRLAMLGLLLARTRMMDMGLTRYEQIDETEQAFLQDLEALEKRE